jgi:hypothetical protein
MAYVTVAEWKAYRGTLSGAVQVAFTALEDASLQLFLDQAQSELERLTGKKFEAETETRYFRAGALVWANPKRLLLDKWLLQVTTLTNGDGAVISASDYWLHPRGAGPYHAIELKSSVNWRFNTDGEIAVTGAWGFMQQADEGVKRVVMRLAEFYYQKRGVTGESQVIGDGQIVLAAQYPKDVQDFITAERRRVPR